MFDFKKLFRLWFHFDLCNPFLFVFIVIVLFSMCFSFCYNFCFALSLVFFFFFCFLSEGDEGVGFGELFHW